ncbi:carboxypeptidase A1-like [Haliotis rufescens]|uniref:carboxypeptidase A1-like n=1 Tax=Haliotis rufescens TaxID=6454 RepID=UPI00201EE7F6|nr:carboxypeptidase A1-like [Haliotis rufescens]
MLENNGIDVWRSSSGPNSSLDFMLPPDMDAMMDSLALTYTVQIPDVEKAVQISLISNEQARLQSSATTFNYAVYHPMSEIYQWMSDTQAVYSSYVTIMDIGSTNDGNDIKALKVSVSSDANRPAVFIESALHAREWVSPASVLWMTNELLQQYGTDADVTAILDEFDIYIIPVVNVDGYIYSWLSSNTRLWRKNRDDPRSAKEIRSGCIGTDLNRNFRIRWAAKNGASPDPCSVTYKGSRGFSELETRAMTNFVKSIGNRVAFVDIHSYGQLLLYPLGYRGGRTIDDMDFRASAQAATAAITAVHGTNFIYGSVYSIIQKVTGDSIAYMYKKAVIKYSVALELRDRGTYGFLLPADQIIPTGEETLAGILAFLDYVSNNP